MKRCEQRAFLDYYYYSLFFSLCVCFWWGVQYTTQSCACAFFYPFEICFFPKNFLSFFSFLKKPNPAQNGKKVFLRRDYVNGEVIGSSSSQATPSANYTLKKPIINSVEKQLTHKKSTTNTTAAAAATNRWRRRKKQMSDLRPKILIFWQLSKPERVKKERRLLNFQHNSLIILYSAFSGVASGFRFCFRSFWEDTKKLSLNERANEAFKFHMKMRIGSSIIRLHNHTLDDDYYVFR